MIFRLDNLKSLSVCFLLLLPVPLAGQEASKSPKAKEVLPSLNELNQPILKALATPVSFDYDETPVVNIMDELGNKFGIDFVLDQTARDDSLTEDDTLTIALRRAIRLDACLKLMLAEKNATITVQDGVVRIISMDVADSPESFMTRVLDCRTLLKRLTDIRMKEFAGDSQPPVRWEQKMIAGESLIDTVKSTCAVDAWDDTNGDGSIENVHGLLVISQTYYHILQIEELLNELESKLSQANEE